VARNEFLWLLPAQNEKHLSVGIRIGVDAWTWSEWRKDAAMDFFGRLERLIGERARWQQRAYILQRCLERTVSESSAALAEQAPL
jgi:hypothetical protein